MGLHDKMRDLIEEHPRWSDEDLAKVLLTQAHHIEFLQMLTEEFGHIRRAIQRQEEVAEMAKMHRTPVGSAWGPRIRREIRSLGDGTKVSLGQMTIAQHKIRIAMLRTQVAGINETIRVHERAIRDIEKAGVTCLDEIKEEELI